MMPLAFDLSSTLLIGSIFPVATTERTMGPRSTAASFDGSMGADALDRCSSTQPPPRAAITITSSTMRRNDMTSCCYGRTHVQVP